MFTWNMISFHGQLFQWRSSLCVLLVPLLRYLLEGWIVPIPSNQTGDNLPVFKQIYYAFCLTISKAKGFAKRRVRKVIHVLGSNNLVRPSLRQANLSSRKIASGSRMFQNLWSEEWFSLLEHPASSFDKELNEGFKVSALATVFKHSSGKKRHRLWR